MMSERPFVAELRLVYSDEAFAKAIYEAVRPDNELLPGGLQIRGALKGSSIELEIACWKNVESLRATLDDLLACIQAAERALKAVKKRED